MGRIDLTEMMEHGPVLKSLCIQPTSFWGYLRWKLFMHSNAGIPINFFTSNDFPLSSAWHNWIQRTSLIYLIKENKLLCLSRNFAGDTAVYSAFWRLCLTTQSNVYYQDYYTLEDNLKLCSEHAHLPVFCFTLSQACTSIANALPWD